MMFRLLLLIFIFVGYGVNAAEPLRIKITEGVIEPLPFAAPTFIAENDGGHNYVKKISDLVSQDLTGTGLFRKIPLQAFIS
ncbi:MAG: Tol-Pal system protein TolB, partial [Rhodobacteraceae bacterium]|nr:Tol-Pal system protein TolB [Paracoccaceae bacterium]